jgi:hypothetical protein
MRLEKVHCTSDSLIFEHDTEPDDRLLKCWELFA